MTLQHSCMIQIEVGGRRHAVPPGSSCSARTQAAGILLEGAGCPDPSCGCGVAPVRRGGHPRRRRRRRKCGSTGFGSGRSRPRCCMATRSRSAATSCVVVDEARSGSTQMIGRRLRLTCIGRRAGCQRLGPTGRPAGEPDRWPGVHRHRRRRSYSDGMPGARWSSSSTEVSRRHAEIRPGPTATSSPIRAPTAPSSMASASRVARAGAGRRDSHRRRGVPFLRPAGVARHSAADHPGPAHRRVTAPQRHVSGVPTRRHRSRRRRRCPTPARHPALPDADSTASPTPPRRRRGGAARVAADSRRALKGKRLPVRAPVVNIGRADYNDIVLPDASVSTAHAKLQRREACLGHLPTSSPPTAPPSTASR